MHDHVRFQGLLLDEGLEADVALEGPHAGVDQHVSLQVGGQGELSGADVAFEFFHTLKNKGPLNELGYIGVSGKEMLSHGVNTDTLLLCEGFVLRVDLMRL